MEQLCPTGYRRSGDKDGPLLRTVQTKENTSCLGWRVQMCSMVLSDALCKERLLFKEKQCVKGHMHAHTHTCKDMHM